MTTTRGTETDEGLELARRLAEEEEGIGRRPKGPSRFVVPTLAICWSVFQLLIAKWWILDSTYIRAFHLAFAIAIVYLNIPMLKKPRQGLGFLSAVDRIPWGDYVVAATAALSVLYIVIDYEGISQRYGDPSHLDIVAGFVLVVLLVEAARRVVGPALPTISVLFMLYAFFGRHMPELIYFKGVSLNRFMGQMTMSTEGIYGVPLYVSASTVFLYVLFGSMLDKAGAGQYFIQLALSLLGGFKGGPAKAAVLGSALTGVVSGSSVANVVTTGTFTIPLMKKVGYPPSKAAAVEVAASINGQIAPPVMGAAAFIMAEYVNVPYLEVIKAAAIPAFATYAALFYIVHLEASKLGLRGLPRHELPRFWPTFTRGIHYILPLLFLLYELMVVRHSPNLAALYAVLMLMFIMVVQEPVKAWKAGTPLRPAFRRAGLLILDALASGGRNMVTVALATATAGIIVGVVSMGLGNLVTEVIDRLAMGNLYLMLVITAIASLILGMGLPTTANYIVMASLTAPAIVTLGASYGFMVPLMAAHLFCFVFGILADDTPPVGLASYAAAAIAKAPLMKTGIQGFMYDIRTAILPFMFIFNHELILHGITSWVQSIFIFVMTCIGCFAFAGATQGWVIAKNRIHETVILLASTFVMLRPILISRWMGLPHDMRYWAYPVGLALFGLVFLMQRPRMPREPEGSLRATAVKA